MQVAQNIELFLNSLNQQNGEYYFKKGCDDDTTGPVHIQNNNWAIMAYSGLYESNKNKEYEQKLLENWDLSAEDDSAGDLYTSMQLYELYKLSQKYPNLLTVNDRKGLFRIINSVGSSLISAYVPRNDFAMIIATLSRASFLSSELNNELKFDMSPEVFQNADKLLDMAIERNSNENIILEKNNIKLREGQCWIELAKLKKFEMTNEVSILNESESFFNKLDLSSEFMNPKILDTSIPMNLLPCVEILLILDEKTGNKEYLDDARAILNAYLKYNWDIPQRQFCQGDYGILSKRLINTNPEGRKLMTDNAYFVYLFTQKGIKDYEFGWLK